ncbi:MAG: response regulator [Terriglobia bacterium]
MNGGPARILVVEDDDVEREGIVELLQLWGYEAQAACDGVEALRKLRASHYDLVLSDLDMPRMTGTELLKELQSFSVNCIIISGIEGRLEEAMRLGASAFLQKPVCAERLKGAVLTGVRGRRAVSPGSRPVARRMETRFTL